MRMSLLVAASAFALLAGCSPEPAKPAAVVETPKAAIGTFGIDLTAMDKAVKPGDDFNAIDPAQSTGDTVALVFSGGMGLQSVVKFRWNGDGVELIGNIG